jgi:hypothetical protein
MSEKASTTLPLTLEKIISSPDPRETDKAQIGVDRADELYREIRIENALRDDKADQVRLEVGNNGAPRARDSAK